MQFAMRKFCNYEKIWLNLLLIKSDYRHMDIFYGRRTDMNTQIIILSLLCLLSSIWKIFCKCYRPLCVDLVKVTALILFNCHKKRLIIVNFVTHSIKYCKTFMRFSVRMHAPFVPIAVDSRDCYVPSVTVARDQYIAMSSQWNSSP